MSDNGVLSSLSDEPIENVYLYIGDAVRWDSVPDRLLQKGVSIKSIAAGIHSPTSITSLVSGTNLAQHGVKDFTDQISPEVPSLLDMAEINVTFINSINDVRFDPSDSESIIANTLRTTVSDPDTLETITTPFFALERGPGGHAPYVRDTGMATEYFESRGDANQSQFRQEYNRAVEEDIDWFFSRISTLRERGVLDETLIIYVSDHGELLGENGTMAHSPPIHPKHVYVPTIFIHPKLPDRIYRREVARHTDIAATVLPLLNHEPDTAIKPVGKNLIVEELSQYGVTVYENNREIRFTDIDFQYDSIWDTNGGYVFHRSSKLSQLLQAGHRLFHVPWRKYARSNLASYLYFQLRGSQQHGTPGFTFDEGKKMIEQLRNDQATSDQGKEVDVPRERLRELGYLE